MKQLIIDEEMEKILAAIFDCSLKFSGIQILSLINKVILSIKPINDDKNQDKETT